MERARQFSATLAATGGRNDPSGSTGRRPRMSETEVRVRKVTDKVSESFQILANEPSLALYRIEEHVRKSVPSMVEQRKEIENVHRKIQGRCFDIEYSIEAIRSVSHSRDMFVEMLDMLKSSLFMKQQIDHNRQRQKAKLERRTRSIALDESLQFSSSVESTVRSRTTVAELLNRRQSAGGATRSVEIPADFDASVKPEEGDAAKADDEEQNRKSSFQREQRSASVVDILSAKLSTIGNS